MRHRAILSLCSSSSSINDQNNTTLQKGDLIYYLCTLDASKATWMPTDGPKPLLIEHTMWCARTNQVLLLAWWLHALLSWPLSLKFLSLPCWLHICWWFSTGTSNLHTAVDKVIWRLYHAHNRESCHTDHIRNNENHVIYSGWSVSLWVSLVNLG